MPDQREGWTITISRQMGSLGQESAFLLGEMLSYRVVWREVINQAARQAGAPDAALAAIDEFGFLGFCPSPETCQAYRTAVEQVMHELAKEGRVIIIGRAGQVILGGQPDVFHVRLIAPADVRAERVAKRQKIPLSAAQAQIEASDKFRRNYVKRFYQIDWDAPEYYDLVINTARLDPDRTAALIALALPSASLGAMPISWSEETLPQNSP